MYLIYIYAGIMGVKFPRGARATLVNVQYHRASFEITWIFHVYLSIGNGGTDGHKLQV